MAPQGEFPLTGVGYICQLEHEYMGLHKLCVCANCFAVGFQLQQPLKRCNGCRLIDYCSKECQKKHWSKHKGFCNMAQGKGPKNGYLSKLKTPEEVFRILTDSYRLRVDYDHTDKDQHHGIFYEGRLEDGSVWADGDATADFQKWLDLAEDAGVLPEWWRFENRMECLSEAVDKTNKNNIFVNEDQEHLLTKYEGEVTIRSALCILAELVVGYDGKGRATNDEWFRKFQEHLDLHPEEKAQMISGTVEAVKQSGIPLTQTT